MCQLNVYCVPKSVDKDKVLALMQEKMGYSVAECIDEENLLPELKDKYSFYISGGMRCNCDSLPCKFQDKDEQLSFVDCWEDILSEQRNRLYRLRDLMEQKDYAKQKRAFDKVYKELYKEFNKAFDVGREFERRKTQEIMEDDSLTDEEKNKRMHEEVYPEVNRLLQSIDQDPRVKKYQAFLEENRTMWETYSLTKKRAKKKLVKARPLGEEGEEVEIPFPSFCIYDMIDDLENHTGKSAGQAEYEQLIAFIDGVLELAPEMKIFSFWQDGEKVKIESRKSISRKDFNIDKIIHLKYLELLTIEK